MPHTLVINQPAVSRGARLLQVPLIRIAVAFFFVAVPFAIVAFPFNMFVTDKSLKRVGALLLCIVIVTAYCAYVRFIEKRRATEFSSSGALTESGGGLLLGALLFSTTVGILAALGVYQVTGSNGWAIMLGTIPGFIMTGFLEEVVFRGIVFRIVEASLGSWIALAVSAAIFGLMHLLNHGATLLDAGAITIEGGIMLAAAYMVTRRLWLCVGIHIAWNFVQGGVFSVTVSGGAQKGLLQAKLVGADWITGGAFGVEGSVVALAVCAAAGVALLIVAKRKDQMVRPFWNRWNSDQPDTLVNR